MRRVFAAVWTVLQHYWCACWLVLTLTILTSVPGCHQDRTPKPLMDFALPQARGGVFHLHTERPHAVLLAFLQTVPDTADTPSRQEAAFLLSMHHQYNARGLRVAIVDSSALVTNQPPKHDALTNAGYDWQLDIPLLEDEGNRVARSWGVTKVPTLMLLAPDGSIAQRWQGLTGPAILAQGIQKMCAEPSGHNGDSAP
jgi:peroxiredoxin